MALVRTKGLAIGLGTAIALCITSSTAHPVYSDERMDAAILKIEGLGGKIIRGEDAGKIQSIFFLEKKVVKKLTDADIESIDFGVFGSVKQLLVGATEITDRSLDQFSKIRELESFDLIGAKITDKGIAAFLKKQKLLSSLSLKNTPVTDEGLSGICNNDTLRMVALSRTRITDKTAKGLANLTELYVLDLSKTEITDAALPEIAKISNLLWLNLDFTKITDAGIQSLAALKELRILDVRDTNITREGADALQKQLPNLKVNRQ